MLEVLSRSRSISVAVRLLSCGTCLLQLELICHISRDGCEGEASVFRSLTEPTRAVSRFPRTVFDTLHRMIVNSKQHQSIHSMRW
jgi:hypothetical protein